MNQSDIHHSALETGQEEKQKTEGPTLPDDIQKAETTPYRQDVFGDEEHAEVKYKTLKWWYVHSHFQAGYNLLIVFLCTGNAAF